MISRIKARISTSKIKLIVALPVALSVFVIAGASASASIGPILYTSQKVTFNLPSKHPDTWELTLWHDGVMEGRETGTFGQQLNIYVPTVPGCNFQIDARNLTVSPNVITYSAHEVIDQCGQSQSDQNG